MHAQQHDLSRGWQGDSLLPFPSVFPVRTHLFEIALEAESVVAADRTAAPRAVPLLLFFSKKIGGTVFLDVHKIFNHAHVVPGTVPLVEVLQTPAREIAALIAEPYKPEPEPFAAFLHECTIFTAGQAAFAVFSVETFLLQIVLLRLVADAQRTVHPAGSNKYLFHSESPRFIFCVRRIEFLHRWGPQ